MKALYQILFFLFFSSFLQAATYYSIADGAWDDPNTWVDEGGDPVVGPINEELNSFYIINGNTIDFTGYSPSSYDATNRIYVQNGILNSTSSMNGNDFWLYISNNGIIDITGNLYPRVTYFSGNGIITVSEQYSTVYYISDGISVTSTINANNVFITNYNYAFWSATLQNNDLTTTINITSPTGTVEIDNYYDSDDCVLTINGGDFDLDDVAADIRGDIIVDGELILPNTYTYNVYGTLQGNFTSNYSFDHNARLWNIKNGGILRLIGDGTSTITSSDNLQTKGFQIEAGGTVNLRDINYSQTANSGGPYSIAGTFSIEDGNFHHYGDIVTIQQTGKLILIDRDRPAIGDINKGIYNMYWGSKILNNYGLFMAEKYETHNSGSNIFNNYEVMFIKAFVTDANDNTINVLSSTIDNADYLEPNRNPPPENYTGSYLYYCSESAPNFDRINKDADANIFMPEGASYGTGDTIFADESECFDRFYDDISVILPITLQEFKGNLHPNGVELEWTTCSEKNNEYFTIWKSNTVSNFDEIVSVQGAGNSIEKNTYTYLDKKPYIGNNYYRLSQTDYDGTTEYFPIIAVHYLDNYKIGVSPTIVSSYGEIKIETGATNFTAKLLNINGIELIQKKSNQQSDIIQLNGNIAPGNYILHVQVGYSTITENIIVY
jgi:hypothetical protein